MSINHQDTKTQSKPPESGFPFFALFLRDFVVIGVLSSEEDYKRV